MPTDIERFRQANRYAVQNGAPAGFCTFFSANHGQGVVWGTYLFKKSAVEFKDINKTDLDPFVTDFGQWMRAANRYAGKHGYAGGFPNFEVGHPGGGTVYGVYFFKPGAVEWRDVAASDLGNPNINDIPARFKASATLATKLGFPAAMPNCENADYGHGTVYGTFFIKPGMVDWRDVPEATLFPPSAPLPNPASGVLTLAMSQTSTINLSGPYVSRVFVGDVPSGAHIVSIQNITQDINGNYDIPIDLSIRTDSGPSANWKQIPGSGSVSPASSNFPVTGVYEAAPYGSRALLRPYLQIQIAWHL